jgi:hypothetical protein
MAILISSEDIELWQTELASSSEALAALNVLADCEGDLEDAAITVALQVGQEPDISDRWIEGLAKRWRHVICHADLRERLEDGLSTDVLALVRSETELPVRLALLVAIYVNKTGLETFCKPLEAKI